MGWPNDTGDTLVDVASGDYMDGTGTESDVVLDQIVTLLELFIAEFGPGIKGSYGSLAARLAALLDTTTGGTITGPVVMSGATAFLTLNGDPPAALDAATKQYLDARIDALFPGGLVLTALANRDTIIKSGAGWVNAPSGL
jgi:hypothetical protein